MSWQSKSREEIGMALQQKLRKCRDRRDELSAELRLLDAAIRDAAGSPDGTAAARSAKAVSIAILAANTEYTVALEQFTAFVIEGKAPPED